MSRSNAKKARERSPETTGGRLAYFTRVLPVKGAVLRLLIIALALAPFVYLDNCNPPVSSFKRSPVTIGEETPEVDPWAP